MPQTAVCGMMSSCSAHAFAAPAWRVMPVTQTPLAPLRHSAPWLSHPYPQDFAAAFSKLLALGVPGQNPV